jgi:hypothetical protein
MEFYWNNVAEKSGLLKPSDITDCTVYARPLYARVTVCILVSLTRLFHSAPFVHITESGSKRLPLCNAVIAILFFTWSRDQNCGKPRIQKIDYQS